MNEGESSGATNTPEIGGASPQVSPAPNINTQQEQKVKNRNRYNGGLIICIIYVTMSLWLT